MKMIPLTRGQFTIVDDEDYESLARHSWYARWNRSTQSFYATRSVGNGKTKKGISMHRQILGLIAGDGVDGDHINGNTLDNRKSVNLRKCTRSQNLMNRPAYRKNKTGLKGVSLHMDGKYRATIFKNYKQKHLGLFDTPEQAHEAYKIAAKELHGDFSNFGS